MAHDQPSSMATLTPPVRYLRASVLPPTLRGRAQPHRPGTTCPAVGCTLRTRPSRPRATPITSPDVQPDEQVPVRSSSRCLSQRQGTSTQGDPSSRGPRPFGSLAASDPESLDPSRPSTDPARRVTPLSPPQLGRASNLAASLLARPCARPHEWPDQSRQR